MSPFLAQLRQKVGHDLLLLPSVTVLAFNAEGQVLLVRHANNNVWVAPGGMIEVDEAPAEAARREMGEETGCEVELLGILGVYGGPAATQQAAALRTALSGRSRNAVRAYRGTGSNLLITGTLGPAFAPGLPNDLLEWLRGK